MKKLAVLAAFFIQPARADSIYYLTGTQLDKVCNVAENNPVSDNACRAYVLGAIDGLSLGTETSLCIPMGAERSQAQKIVSKWLRDHPEHLHMAAAECVQQAVADAFPCPAPGK